MRLYTITMLLPDIDSSDLLERMQTFACALSEEALDDGCDEDDDCDLLAGLTIEQVESAVSVSEGDRAATNAAIREARET